MVQKVQLFFFILIGVYFCICFGILSRDRIYDVSFCCTALHHLYKFVAIFFLKQRKKRKKGRKRKNLHSIKVDLLICKVELTVLGIQAIQAL